jgi:hypothetical protein
MVLFILQIKGEMNMVPAWQQLDQTLQVVAAEQRDAGEIVPGGASDDDIEAASRLVKEAFGIELPESYKVVLQQRNGIDYNGVVFYSAVDSPQTPGSGGFWQGLVAANKAWRDSGENSHLLILGDNSMDFFAFDPQNGEFNRHDRVTGEILKQYQNVTEMISDALSDHD